MFHSVCPAARRRFGSAATSSYPPTGLVVTFYCSSTPYYKGGSNVPFCESAARRRFGSAATSSYPPTDVVVTFYCSSTSYYRRGSNVPFCVSRRTEKIWQSRYFIVPTDRFRIQHRTIGEVLMFHSVSPLHGEYLAVPLLHRTHRQNDVVVTFYCSSTSYYRRGSNVPFCVSAERRRFGSAATSSYPPTDLEVTFYCSSTSYYRRGSNVPFCESAARRIFGSAATSSYPPTE
ncbi:hypothetical protein J6590_040787 [Homalodisca vitripennis]|nr:hypothetical protein J6590_040787 [Homalodisca vitripennis]